MAPKYNHSEAKQEEEGGPGSVPLACNSIVVELEIRIIRVSIWLFANTNVYCSKAHSISPVIDDDNNDHDDGPAGHGGLFGKLKIHPYA